MKKVQAVLIVLFWSAIFILNGWIAVSVPISINHVMGKMPDIATLVFAAIMFMAFGIVLKPILTIVLNPAQQLWEGGEPTY